MKQSEQSLHTCTHPYKLDNLISFYRFPPKKESWKSNNNNKNFSFVWISFPAWNLISATLNASACFSVWRNLNIPLKTFSFHFLGKKNWGAGWPRSIFSQEKNQLCAGVVLVIFPLYVITCVCRFVVFLNVWMFECVSVSAWREFFHLANNFFKHHPSQNSIFFVHKKEKCNTNPHTHISLLHKSSRVIS